MTVNEYLKIKEMVGRLIGFLLWKGATFESKKKKVIKELMAIREYSLSCVKANPDEVDKLQSIEVN